MVALNQPVSVTTPLGEELQFFAMSLTEEISRPFQMTLTLGSRREDLAFESVLGLDACVRLERAEGGPRFFHGLISTFSQTGRQNDLAMYQMQLRPWLWFLSHSADCRIYQQMTVPDVIKAVFREHGFSDFREDLREDYRSFEYLIQYRETTFNFVSRLMEQEGMYYFVEHEATKHTIVIADSISAHEPVQGGATIPFIPPSNNRVREEHIFDWSRQQSVRTGEYMVRSFDFRSSGALLEETSAIPREHALSDKEVFDYPGEFLDDGTGPRYAKVRMEELQAKQDRAVGIGDMRNIAPGGLFTLERHPRRDQNKEHLVVAAQHQLRLGDYRSGDDNGFSYECSFECMDSRESFRPARSTPKPVVQGPQTAIVTGPSGEEIYTDEFGRIRVKFHWDRHSARDETSSCWVRVVQAWAGSNWGAMYIPRIDQEVMVEFVEGDPDRPIVTGSLYNDANMPPYTLPDNKTVSTLKSRSTKDGTPDNFNEIKFEDMKGSEKLYFHAEKDHTINVENNKTEWVGNDNTETIDNNEKITVKKNRDKTVEENQSETIGIDKSISVGSNHTESIGVDKSVSVGSNHTETVGSNQQIQVGANQVLTVADNQNETVGGAKAETIAKAKALTIGGGYQVTVGGGKNQTVGGAKAEEVGKDSSESVGGDRTMSVGGETKIVSDKDITIDGKKKAAITVADELSITVGKAKIIMKKNGDITIQGNKINMKGSGNVTIKGKKILEN